MRISYLLWMSFSLTILSGCGSIKEINETERLAELQADMAEQYARQPRAESQRPIFRVTETPWVDGTPLALPKPVPGVLQCELTYNPANSVTLDEFSSRVAELCGLSIHITQDAAEFVNPKERIGNSSGSEHASDLNAMLGLPGQNITTTMPLSPKAKRFSITWRGGPLHELLDRVASELGLIWEYGEGRGITMRRLVTRTFPIYTFAMSSNWGSRISSGTSVASGVSSSSGGGGESSGGVSGVAGSESSSEMALQSSVLDDINQDIATMLTPELGKMSMSASTGSVTVSDLPDVLNQVQSYIEHLNNVLTQQVVVNAKVISVQLNKTDAYGIDWNLVYRSAGRNLGFNLGSTGGALDSASNFTFDILDTSRGVLAGTNAILRALSEQGKVSVNASPSSITTNLQPVPIQVARQTGYLQSTSTTVTTNVGATTQFTPGMITTGLAMNVLPYILPEGNNQILLQFNVSLSSLISLRPTPSGIQIPEIDSRSFSQRVKIRSGETVVLTGFDQTSNTTDKRGVGNPNNILLGGQHRASQQRDLIIILLTPVIRS